VCLIDEFGCIRNEDRTTIHEAMEQQTLSVAKAGIVCKLNCRATIIAVMNPRNCIYDNQLSLAQNTGLGTPLLSRFDLIFKLVDSCTYMSCILLKKTRHPNAGLPTHVEQLPTKSGQGPRNVPFFLPDKFHFPTSFSFLINFTTADAERDSNVTTYLLNRAIQGTDLECAKNITSEIAEEESPWSMEKLRAYIAVVKDRFQPTISDEAAILLEAHYEKVRSAQSFTIPITVRFLESLIRLSQSHARLMYRNIVTLEDAIAVLRIMECSAMCYGGFDGNVADPENILYNDPMHMDTYINQPDEDFVVFEYNILKRYNMLEYMLNDSRIKALALLEGEDDNAKYSQNETWSNINNPHDRQTTIIEDHYGRSYFSPNPSCQRTPNSSTKRRKVE